MAKVITFLNKWSYSFETPVKVHKALQSNQTFHLQKMDKMFTRIIATKTALEPIGLYG